MTKFSLFLSMVLAIGSFANVSAAMTKPASGLREGRSVPACTAAQLTVAIDSNFEGDAAMGGQRGDQFIIKNTSARPCTLRGTPGVSLYDSSGRKMGASVRPTRSGSKTLPGRGSMTFEFDYHSCQFVAGASGRNPKKCRLSRTARVQLFGISRTFSVREKIDADNGVEQVTGLESK